MAARMTRGKLRKSARLIQVFVLIVIGVIFLYNIQRFFISSHNADSDLKLSRWNSLNDNKNKNDLTSSYEKFKFSFFDKYSPKIPYGYLNIKGNDKNDKGKQAVDQIVSKAIRRPFFDDLFYIYKKYAPTVDPCQNYPQGNAKAVRLDKADFKNEIGDKIGRHLVPSAEFIRNLYEKHKSLLNALPKKTPEGLFGGNGIVTVSGGKYFPILIVSLRCLRVSGSKIPVEVFLPSRDEYEPNVCEDILPGLNAKCVILDEELGVEVISKLDVRGYQLKILASIASSFENILLLDVDNIPVRNVDNFFYSEPFKSSGLVTWPDYWARTVSTAFYIITGLYDDPQRRLPEPSTESGQVLISKSTHMKTLMLAVYYNLYGPDYYYPLLSQGAIGEGDKETFLAAAVVSNETFYAVRSGCGTVGFFDGGEYHGTTMIQAEPRLDYEEFKNDDYNAFVFNQQLYSQNTDFAPVAFFHVNYPKQDAARLISQNLIKSPTTGEFIRLLGTAEKVKSRVNEDFELNIWKQNLWMVCDKKIPFKAWEEYNLDDICKQAQDYYEFLLKTTD